MNVAITSDGKYIAVGARYHDGTIDAKQMQNTGMVQVYKYETSGYTTLDSKIVGERGESEIGSGQ